jgi:hypothetical protein
MSEDKKTFSDYMYQVENMVDEFVIAFLSFGAVFVAVWAILFQDVGMVTLGERVIAPWIGTLALMLIAREMWFINRKMDGGGEE